MMKPAVLKVLLQLLAALQATPSGQHWRGWLAGVCSADSDTATSAPSVAVGWLSVALARPLASKVMSVGASTAPPLADKVAVCPSSEVLRLLQGRELSAQADTVTVLPRQATLLLGSDTS